MDRAAAVVPSRDRLVRYVAGELGDPGGILIADETGFLKTGRRSAGVQRQYTGTAGKITTCQVGVFLAYAVPAAGVRVLVDRELYVPESWTGDRDRCGEAGIGEDVTFATKPQLGRTMVERVRELGLPFAWFTADEAYGDKREAAGLTAHRRWAVRAERSLPGRLHAVEQIAQRLGVGSERFPAVAGEGDRGDGNGPVTGLAA